MKLDLLCSPDKVFTMKRFLPFLITVALLLVVGCVPPSDFSVKSTIVKKIQNKEQRSKHFAEYIIRHSDNGAYYSDYILLHENFGQVGDVISFSEDGKTMSAGIVIENK